MGELSAHVEFSLTRCGSTLMCSPVSQCFYPGHFGMRALRAYGQMEGRVTTRLPYSYIASLEDEHASTANNNARIFGQ